MPQLTIALSKGRVLREALPLLATAGIKPSEDIRGSRKLIFDTSLPHVRFLLLRSNDVPTYVQFGAADMGVSGNDILLEHGGNGLYSLIDLGIARCKLMTAGNRNYPEKKGRIKVATKYINIARDFYAKQGQQADFIKLYGAMELAPIMNLSDEIVDIVDTGNTLRANGLEPRITIADISSRLIANRASIKMKHEIIKPIIDAVSSVVA